jgi:hypothetical protein
MIHDRILDTIGRTPVVRVQRLAPDHVTMYVKCEFFNPLGSKDRFGTCPRLWVDGHDGLRRRERPADSDAL